MPSRSGLGRASPDYAWVASEKLMVDCRLTHDQEEEPTKFPTKVRCLWVIVSLLPPALSTRKKDIGNSALIRLRHLLPQGTWDRGSSALTRLRQPLPQERHREKGMGR